MNEILEKIKGGAESLRRKPSFLDFILKKESKLSGTCSENKKQDGEGTRNHVRQETGDAHFGENSLEENLFLCLVFRRWARASGGCLAFMV